MLNENLKIEVLVSSTSAHAAGFSVDTTVVLPMEPEELQKKIEAFNRSASKISEEPCSEIYLADYRYDYPHGENIAKQAIGACRPDDLETANIIAMEMQSMGDTFLDKCDALMQCYKPTEGIDTLSICYNIIDIPAWKLDHLFREYMETCANPEHDHCKPLDRFDPYEMLGYLLLERDRPGSYLEMDENSLPGGFDLGQYGRNEALKRGIEIRNGWAVKKNFNIKEMQEIAWAPADLMKQYATENYLNEKKWKAANCTGNQDNHAPHRAIGQEKEIGKSRGAR